MKITREIQGVMADHFTIDLPKPFRNTPLQIMITTLPLTRKSRSVIGLWKDRFSNNKSSAEIQSEQREAQWPGN